MLGLGGSQWMLIAAAAAAVVVGAYVVALKGQVALARSDAADAHEATAACETSLGEVKVAVAAQNAAVDALRGRCEAEAIGADVAALRALSAPQTIPEGQGPEALNLWLDARLRR